MYSFYVSKASNFIYTLFLDHKYAPYQVDWIRATFSSIYKSHMVGIFQRGLFILLRIGVFRYVSITDTIRSGHKTI